jgi:flavin reductase (DIM6/NTAB) family NADH-FMN oxidoreductase RutF
MPIEDASRLFDNIDRIVWLVTARAGTRCGGFIATFVNSASLVPKLPRVLIAVAKHHHTWTLIEESGAFALHLLGEQNLDLVWRFGLQSGAQVNKFEGLATTLGATLSPLLPDTLAVIECRVENRMDVGDRTVYVAEVVSAERRSDAAPLTEKRMRTLAPAQKVRELDRRQENDIESDTASILAWRHQAVHD